MTTLPSLENAGPPCRQSAERVRHVETFPPTFIYPKTVSQETSHDRTQHTHIENWENEGGTHTDLTRARAGRDSLNSISYLNSYIDTAEASLSSGNYDEACQALEAAAERFSQYRDKIKSSFDYSIAHLTTKGCRATPPDPRALKLIRLRRKLAP